MTISVDGFNSEYVEFIGFACQDALTALERSGNDLVVGRLPDDYPAPGIGNSTGVKFKLSALEDAFSSDPNESLKLIDEEVAHHVLCLEDVPSRADNDLSEFFQELFATWFQYRRAFDRSGLDQLTTSNVEADALYYVLGKDLGAALAGSNRNQEKLAEWLDDPAASEGKKQLVLQMQETLVLPLTPEVVATEYQKRN